MVHNFAMPSREARHTPPGQPEPRSTRTATTIRSQSPLVSAGGEAHRLLLLGSLRRGQSVPGGPHTVTTNLGHLVRPVGVVGLDRAPEVVAERRGTFPRRRRGALLRHRRHARPPDGSFDVVHAHQVCDASPGPVSNTRSARCGGLPGGVLASAATAAVRRVRVGPRRRRARPLAGAVPRRDSSQRRRGRCRALAAVARRRF